MYSKYQGALVLVVGYSSVQALLRFVNKRFEYFQEDDGFAFAFGFSSEG